MNRLEVSSVGEQELLLGQISDQVAEQYQDRIPKIIEGLCIIASAAILICLESVSLAILFTGMGLIQIVPVFTYEKWTKKIYEEAWDSDEAEIDWITQGVDGIRTLKAYRAENWFINRYRKINRRGVDAGNRAVTTGGFEGILYAAIDAGLRYGSYLILGLYVLRGSLSVTSLPVLVVLSGYIFSSMDKLFNFFRYRATYRLALDRLRGALRQEPLLRERSGIQAEGITLSFDGKLVLDSVSLCVKPYERVQLVGRNGSGKSTLLRVLLGELTPDAGIVRVDAKVAVALQDDPVLATPATSFLEALSQQPDWHRERFEGYLRGFRFPEALLKRSIQELSGGERKKIFLSVALARDVDILILDEPTNHLDAHSRDYLKCVLARCSSALLVCTHDPDFQLEWDRTVLLEGGRNHG